ncbi:DUF4236 domain-containing protein [Mesorhizobium mediterraneum]|uniref:DUF4236 domain-containing protein n=1 Tax=Mesorhizobium mediterraneum TaxID=43617 RepID=UPI00177BFEB9|nr:DUF4236 domain-containing protein [Mesorhizobium mediterraneum]
MVFRFRKSVRIAPGVRINLNAKSASVRVGPKGLGYTVSTTGKKRLSASIPGPFPRIPESLVAKGAVQVDHRASSPA